MSLPAHLSSPREARVSIAMATYNGARFIQEQLDSFLAQTHLPWELVITDDQSTDTTEQIVKAFAEKAPFRVRFIRNEDRLYFSSNFMKAASLCEGDFIAFSDQDDIWDPRKIELSLEALAQPGVVLCVHDATKVNEQLEPIGLETRRGVPKGILRDIDPFLVFSGFTCTFPRALLDLLPAQERPYDLIEPHRPLTHDRWICYLASLVGYIANLPDLLALYRQHDSNAAGWMRDDRSAKQLFLSLRDKFGLYIEKRLQILQQLAKLAKSVNASALDTNLFSAQQLAKRQGQLDASVEAFTSRRLVAQYNSRVLRLIQMGRGVLRLSYRDPVTKGWSKRSLRIDFVGSLVGRRDQLDLARQQLPQAN